MDKPTVLRELRQIPGVGKSIAEDLWQLGIRSVQDLRDRDPEELYLALCAQQGTRVDRCMLYVFRCAVYYASHEARDPELLKWWVWKDKESPGDSNRGLRSQNPPARIGTNETTTFSPRRRTSLP